MLLPGETAEDVSNPETCWSFIEPWGATPSNCELERFAVWRFQAKWAEQWTSGRMAIAGDAAQTIPEPAGVAAVRDPEARHQLQHEDPEGQPAAEAFFLGERDAMVAVHRGGGLGHAPP